jgi:hypothetical protein
MVLVDTNMMKKADLKNSAFVLFLDLCFLECFYSDDSNINIET